MDYEGSDNSGSEAATSDFVANVISAANTAARLNAVPLAPDQNNVIVLPAGASLDDIKVNGRDLVITLDDGRTFVIADGAVFVPVIMIDGVTVPPLNLAALLTSNDPQPAAGPVGSSGGNFADPVDPIQPAYNLGDLLPYTELAFPQPKEEEVLPAKPDRDPDVVIADGAPASKNAVDNVSEVGLPGTRTNGNVESPGSSSGNGSDSTSGTIIITSPDGIASVTINGITYTGVGQVITTPRGTLTLGALNTADEITYTYRLTDNTSGDAATDLFTVIVTDPDGDTSTATLTIQIADDVPTARNDTDTVPGASYAPESGNVLSGSGTTSGSAGADTLGADGAVVTGFRAGSATAFSSVGTAINGQYGTLTLNANGTYTYTRAQNTPGGVNDVFTYQIADGDGDTSTATLTITIADSPNVITFIPSTGDAVEVHEPHLPARPGEPAGTQFDGDAETATGTMTFTSPDGVQSVSVNGVTITPGALPQPVVSNSTGTLVITGYTYNPATGAGTITYVYTLNDNTLNTDGVSISFPISVTDLDGDTANGQLVIKVIDDAPVAVNDTDSVAAGQYGPVTGNVITDASAGDADDGDTGADTVGADGATVTAITGAAAGTVGGTTTGQYGVLTINVDGSYSYTRDAGSPGGVSDVFTYTITDGDGDKAIATLTIAIADSRPLVGENGLVGLDDDALAGGNPDGPGDDANAVNVNGTLSGSGGDGPLSWAFTTHVLPVGFTSELLNSSTLLIKQGSVIVLTVTLNTTNGTYSVEQNAPIVHAEGDAENNVGFQIGYSVTDVDGDPASGSLSINVDDDSPTAVNDTAQLVAEDAVGSINGNVMLNDTQGADSAVMTSVVVNGVTVAVAAVGTTSYSNANGAYTFTSAGAWTFDPAPGLPNNVTPVDASFTYTITDGDGDRSSAVQPISVTDGAPPLGGDAASLSVDDQNLADGSTPGALTSSDTIGFTAGSDPIATIAFSSDLTNLDPSLTWTWSANQIVGKAGVTPIVTLDLVRVGDNATVTLTLNDNYALHTGLNADDLKALGSVQVIATDSDGDTATGTVSLSVSDDVPLARADADSVKEDGPLVADGNVITASGGVDLNGTDGAADTKGADGAVVSAVAFGETVGTVGTALAGNYGTLTLSADGSYKYELNNTLAAVQGLDSDDTLTEVFTYTIKDGDNDTSTTTLTITINGSDDPITINGLNVDAPELIVDEDDLIDGSSPNAGALTQTGSFTVNGADGIAGITIEGAPIAVNQTFSTAYGTFTITSVSGPVDGTQASITIGYSYVLTDSTTTHATANGQNFLTEVFDIAVVDTDGSTDTDTIEVRIIDDVPTAQDDAANQDVENAVVVINAFTNDTFGADGVDTDNNPATVVTFTQPPVGQGAVAYNAVTGLFTYTQAPGQTGSTSFTYTIKDADGDTSTATVTINLLTDSVPTVTVTDTTVNEDGLPARAGEAAGSSTGSNSHIGNGTFSISTGGDTLQALEVQDKNGAWINVTAGGTVTGFNGTLVVTLTAGNYSYVYTLADNLENHPDNVIDGDGLSDTADPLAGEAFSVRVTDNDGSVGALDTLNVTVLDDAPTALNDTARTVAEDAVGSINGNVMLNDTQGADSAVMTSVVVNGVTVAVAAVGATNYSNANGAYTFTAAGAWTFDPAPGLPNNVTPVDASFTYTITDGDGDPSSAVQPIEVTDGAPPSGGDTASLSVDDDNLGDGSSPGVLTSSDTINFTAGSDPISTIAFSNVLTGLDASLTWTWSANQIVGKAGATTIVTLDLVRVGDNATVTLTLNDNYALHTGLNADDLKALGSVQVIATDSDGDTATGTVSLSVSDDVPTISAAIPANASLAVDETVLGADATANFSGLFTKNYYADGQATTNPLIYELGVSAAGVNSGLIDVVTSNQILLRVVGGVVEGYLSGSTSVVAFTVSINSSGVATLDQIRALQHPTNPDPNEPIGLASAGLITLKATIKDGDGDTASATANIGNALQFRDDGPSITAASAEPVTILATQDAETDGNPTAQDTASANFSSAFSVLTSSYGADGAGSTTWAYSVGLKVAAGTASGLFSDGQSITLHMNGTTVEGRVGATVIFSIGVDATSGVVTLIQKAEIDHPTEPTTTTPFDDQFVALANGLVELTGTVTIIDRDGDRAVSSAAIDLGGNVQFHDDGPVAVADTNSVVEGGIVNGNVLLDGTDDTFGADGPATTVPAGGVVGVAAGSDTSNPVTGGLGAPIETSLGFLTLNADGTYTYDAKPNVTSVTVTDTFVYTIRDGDGDTSTVTLTITVNPVTLVADNDTVLVNEAALDTAATGNDVAFGTVTGSQPGLTTETVQGTLSVPGASSFTLSGGGVGTYGTLVLNSGGTYTYTLRNPYDTSPDADNGTQTVSGVEQFTYTATDANGNSITGTITADVIDDVPSVTAALNAGATVTVDETGPNLAATLDTGAIEKGDDPDLAGTNALARSTSGTAVITDTTVYGADGAAATGAKVYSLSVVDGSASGLSLTDGTGINLQMAGGNVVGVVASGTLVGKAAFAVSINAATGVVTVEQYLSILHGNTANPNDAATMTANAIKAVVTVKDGDGDTDASDAVDISGQITFLDDGPSIAVNANAATITVDETGLASGVASIALGTFTQGSDTDKGVGATVVASAATVMSTTTSSNGVDGAGSPHITYSLTLAGGAASASSLLTTTNGTAITLVKVSDAVVVGKVGATNTVAFAIEVNATTGAVKVEQYLSLFHPDSTNPNDPVSLASGDLSIIGTIKDGDGDIATDPAAIGDRITFLDDGPVAVAAAALTMNNTALNSSNAYLDGDLDVDNNYGADGAGAVIFTVASITALQGQNLTSGFASLKYELSPDGTVITATNSDNDSLVFTLSLQPAGSADKYVLNLNQTLDATEVVDFNSGGYNFVGGNGSWAAFTNALPNSQDILLTPMTGGVDSGTVNTNASEGGVGSGNSVGTNESLRVDFVIDVTGSPSNGADYSVLANQNHAFTNHYTAVGANALFTAIGPGKTTTVIMTARDDFDADNDVGDGSLDTINKVSITHGTVTTLITANGTYSVDGINYTVTFSGGLATISGVVDNTRLGAFTTGGYSSIEFAHDNLPDNSATNQPFKIGDFGATTITNAPVDFTVPISIKDGDGDTVTSGNLAITLNPAAPPIVLDLDGDGGEFLSLAAGVAYDYDNDGSAEKTAWVGADDGLLAIDLDGNGVVSSSREFVFGSSSLSDLAGLAAAYDSNGDGMLNASDAEFAKFGVWQDANGNGTSEAGEFQSLVALGIAGISLRSDSVSWQAAGGDVSVLGQAGFVRTDGSRGTVFDASFAIERQAREAVSVSTMTLVAATTAMATGTQGLAEAGAVAAVSGNEGPAQVGANAMASQSLAIAADAPTHSASLLIGGNSGQAAMPEAHSGVQHEQSMPEHLELVEFANGMMGGSEARVEDNISAILGAGSLAGSSDMQAMDALLVMPQALGQAGVTELQMAGIELTGALDDVRDAAFVEAILDRLGGGNADFAVMSEAPHGFADALLDMEIGGDGGALFQHYQMYDANDDQAALAAASV